MAVALPYHAKQGRDNVMLYLYSSKEGHKFL